MAPRSSAPVPARCLPAAWRRRPPSCATWRSCRRIAGAARRGRCCRHAKRRRYDGATRRCFWNARATMLPHSGASADPEVGSRTLRPAGLRSSYLIPRRRRRRWRRVAVAGSITSATTSASASTPATPLAAAATSAAPSARARLPKGLPSSA